MLHLECNWHSLIDKLAEQTGLEWCCDVIIRCGSSGTAILSHRVVLAEKSTLLSLCFADVPSCQSVTLILPDVDEATVKLFLTFVYTGEVQCTSTQRKLLTELLAILCPEQCGDVSFDGEGIQSPNVSTIEESVVQIKSENVEDDCVDAELDDYLFPVDNPTPGSIEDASMDFNTFATNSEFSVIEDSDSIHEAKPDLLTINPFHEFNTTKKCSVVVSDVKELLESLEGYQLSAEDTRLLFPTLGSGRDVDSGSKKSKIIRKKTNVQSVAPVNHLTNCQKCGLSVKSASFTAHWNLHTSQEPYVCTVCHKRFRFLKEHMRTYSHKELVRSEEKLLTCKQCGKSFAKWEYLKKHMAIHTQANPFVCKICKKPFAQRHYLTRHMLLHAEVKPFQCKYCHKGYPTLSRFNEHLRIHTGEKPFKCQQCESAYVYKVNLRIHMRTHTGDKPFPCNVCGRTFSQLSSLNSHMVVHTGEKAYACKYCKKRFALKSTLLTHTVRIHTKKYPHKCPHCKKGMLTKYILKMHIINEHTKDFVRYCDACQKGFPTTATYKYHMTRRHGGESVDP